MRKLTSIALLAGLVVLGAVACDDDQGPLGPEVIEVIVTPDNVLVGKGQSVELNAQVKVSGAASQEVTWSSSNSSVASVSASGNTASVTGESLGTATITAASVADPSKRASAFVQVVEGATVNCEPADGVDPSNVSGTAGVECTIEEETKTASQIEILMDGDVGGSASFSTAASSDEVAQARRDLTVDVDTRKLPADAAKDGNPITPLFPNGTYTVVARVTFDDGSTLEAESFEWTLNNPDQILMTFEGSSLTSNGVTYYGGGDVEFFGTPVAFTGRPFQDVSAQATGSGSTSAATETDADIGSGHGEEHTDSEAAFVFTASTDLNGNEIEDAPDGDGTTVEATDATTDPDQEPSDFILEEVQLHLDFTAPSTEGMALLFEGENASTTATGFLSEGTFEVTGVEDEGVGGGVGFIRISQGDSETDYEGMVSIADLEENTGYMAEIHRTEDAIGNTRVVNASSTDDFAVDKTAPEFSNTEPEDGATVNESSTVQWTVEDPDLASGDDGSGVDHERTTAVITVNESSTTHTLDDDEMSRDGSDYTLDISENGANRGPGDYTVVVTVWDNSSPANESEFTFNFTVEEGS